MTSEELAKAVILATGGNLDRAKEAASVIDAWKNKQDTQSSCDHAGWSFDKNGRCCFKCGAFMVDWGD